MAQLLILLLQHRHPIVAHDAGVVREVSGAPKWQLRANGLGAFLSQRESRPSAYFLAFFVINYFLKDREETMSDRRKKLAIIIGVSTSSCTYTPTRQLRARQREMRQEDLQQINYIDPKAEMQEEVVHGGIMSDIAKDVCRHINYKLAIPHHRHPIVAHDAGVVREVSGAPKWQLRANGLGAFLSQRESRPSAYFLAFFVINYFLKDREETMSDRRKKLAIIIGDNGDRPKLKILLRIDVPFGTCLQQCQQKSCTPPASYSCI
ncbi:hypothetical protein K438DRAFT_2093622 [Mycena galopus ATCC 62051]|nr:hypothetical protein K438DRAFT_2093622 [Mycena galopus ATCC 62051]